MIGKTVSHYRITRQLGAGGMGVVFEAEDLDLHVTRALKFLPHHESANGENLERLRREARAAAGLEHPNICQVHEIGREGDQTFIVMSYLKGRTLGERLDESKHLPLDAALDISMDICRALSTSHRAGVVHRDIKPANVMLTSDGRAVVMDFGLAKVSYLTRVTRTGTTLGTAAYMSPEQARGDPVDARSDIWSLGVVLYEMMAGRAPFGGDHLAAVAYSVQHCEPESPRKLRPDLPVDLDRVLGRALAKDPSQRYQTAEEFLADLTAVNDRQQVDRKTLRHGRFRQLRRNRSWVAALPVILLLSAAALIFWPRPTPVRSIAVLPFANLSGNPEKEYLAEGMATELIFELSRLSGRPRVISRQTTMNYRDSKMSLPEIAHELQVDAVVEASLLQAEDTIKVAIRMIEAGSEETLWADTYEQPGNRIQYLFGTVTRDIARAIDLELNRQDTARLASVSDVDPAAYEAYLKGRFWLGRDKDLGHAAKSKAFFEEAIALDQDFAPAWAGLAQIHANLGVLTGRAGVKNAEIAREAAKRALELDPYSAEGRAALATVLILIDRDWLAAGRQWDQIPVPDRERVPGYPMFLCLCARFDEAIAWSQRLLAEEPMSSERMNNLGMCLSWGRRYKEAEKVYENLLEFYPGHFWGQYGLATCLERTGRHRQAIEVFPESITSSQFLIFGNRARVEGVVEALLNQIEKTGNNDRAFHLSRHYAWLGDKAKALEWLEVASEEYPEKLWLANVVAEFDFLRPEPAFDQCLEKAGFTEEMIAASRTLASDSIIGGL